MRRRRRRIKIQSWLHFTFLFWYINIIINRISIRHRRSPPEGFLSLLSSSVQHEDTQKLQIGWGVIPVLIRMNPSSPLWFRAKYICRTKVEFPLRKRNHTPMQQGTNMLPKRYHVVTVQLTSSCCTHFDIVIIIDIAIAIVISLLSAGGGICLIWYSFGDGAVSTGWCTLYLLCSYTQQGMIWYDWRRHNKWIVDALQPRTWPGISTKSTTSRNTTPLAGWCDVIWDEMPNEVCSAWRDVIHETGMKKRRRCDIVRKGMEDDEDVYGNNEYPERRRTLIVLSFYLSYLSLADFLVLVPFIIIVITIIIINSSLSCCYVFSLWFFFLLLLILIWCLLLL